MSLRLLIPLAVFLGLVGLLIAGLQTADQRKQVVSPLVGKPAPAFELPDLFQPDRMIGSDQFQGRPYLLNVWGSWCYACRIEHPWIERLGREAGIPLVGFNWKDEHEDALRWLQRYGDAWTVHMRDYEGRAAIDWGVYGAPETFLVDADGIIRHKIIGPLDEVIYNDLMRRILELQRPQL